MGLDPEGTLPPNPGFTPVTIQLIYQQTHSTKVHKLFSFSSIKSTCIVSIILQNFKNTFLHRC